MQSCSLAVLQSCSALTLVPQTTKLECLLTSTPRTLKLGGLLVLLALAFVNSVLFQGMLSLARIVNSMVCKPAVRRMFFKYLPWDQQISMQESMHEQLDKHSASCQRLLSFFENSKGGVGVMLFPSQPEGQHQSKALRCAVAQWQAHNNKACIVTCDASILSTGLIRRIQEAMRVPGIAQSSRCAPISSFMPACHAARQPVIVLDCFESAFSGDVLAELNTLALDSVLSKTYKVLVVLSSCDGKSQPGQQTPCKSALLAQKVLGLNRTKFYEV